MNLGKYIIKDGLVVLEPDLMTWAEFMQFDQVKYRKVDRIAGLMLSTIFLGLDHRYGKGEPVLWETMLFNEDERSVIPGFKSSYSPDLGQWRFSYMEEAYEFHDSKVAELRSNLKAALHTGTVEKPPHTT